MFLFGFVYFDNLTNHEQYFAWIDGVEFKKRLYTLPSKPNTGKDPVARPFSTAFVAVVACVDASIEILSNS